jgi:hypothetical protein
MKTVKLRENKMHVKCEECGKVFDLLDEDQAEEYHYGHDCEGE